MIKYNFMALELFELYKKGVEKDLNFDDFSLHQITMQLPRKETFLGRKAYRI